MVRGCAGALVCIAVLLLPARALSQVSITVDPSQDRHPISPLVYGANFAAADQIAQGALTVTRWGGNRTTRYNYQVDADNTGQDYYFENLPGCWSSAANWCSPVPTDPQTQSGANAFLQGALTANVAALFTVPTMGWIAKAPQYGHPFDCSCTATGQDSYDPYQTNCGNGLVGGIPIDCGIQTNTSIAITPQWVQDWASYIVAKFGPSNGRRIYALDNEPALWSSTHRDVRKTRLGYDELWQKMRDNALAILAADPTAEVAGPAEWGWPNYFCSDLDDVSQGCSAASPDRAAHGGEELVAWLLDQANQYEQQNGKRIIHYLDLHYYPQGGSPPEITRSLWDPSYTDPSWINTQIRLVPRMRDWVSGHYPGTKIAISEYDFYHHTEAIGAVTYAEVLGIFGREGLDLATAWAAPAVTDAAFAAYKIFRNYDGAGGAFESTSVRATVTGSGVLAFAAASMTRMTVVIANEGSATTATVSSGAFQTSGAVKVFQHAGTTSDITAQPDAAPDGGTVTVGLPAESITMLVFTGTNPYGDAGTGGGSGSGGASGGTGVGGTNPYGDAGTGGSSGSGGASAGSSSGAASGAGAAISGADGGGGRDSGVAVGGTGAGSRDTSGCGCRWPRERSRSAESHLFALATLMWIVARRRERKARN